MRRGLCLLLLLVAAPAAAVPPEEAEGEENPVPTALIEAPAAPDESATPIRYVIEAIVVRGNRRTEEALIRGELGIAPGDVLTPDDPRRTAAELRLLSLGFFQEVALRVEKVGSRRGGVVLVVEVVERGTLVLNALYLGTSEATALWGGLDIAETNLLGRGILLGGGFVDSSTPTVPEAIPGRAFNLRAAGPPKRGAELSLSGSALYSDGSEFYQAFGVADEVDPKKWVAVKTRRIGGGLGIGADLSRTTRFFAEGRFEAIDARLPDIRTRDLGGGLASAIKFGIHDGQSRLGSIATVIDFDTRSDPVLPSSGRRIAISLEAALPLFGSSYSYAKGVAQGSFFHPAFRRHVIAFHGFAGALFGDAPYFNRFFVGDLNFLLPPRALGLNFATLPSRNFLGTNVAGKRYESFAARALLEYAVPLWRRGAFVYRGDAFAAFGVFGLGSLDDLRARDTGLHEALPIDLTADMGVKLDTYIGIFTLSIANALGRIPL
jgi:hypothetical protein